MRRIVISLVLILFSTAVLAQDHPSQLLKEAWIKSKWSQAIRGIKFQRWDGWIASLDGVGSAPVAMRDASGKNWTVAELCQPHDCADNKLVVVIDRQSRGVWGMQVSAHLPSPRYYGQPSDRMKVLLAAALKGSLSSVSADAADAPNTTEAPSGDEVLRRSNLSGPGSTGQRESSATMQSADTAPSPANSDNDRAVAILADASDVSRHREAFAMLEKAANDGDLRAKANLGLGYLLGVGTPRDLFQGGRLLRAAAEAGEPFAALAVATTHAGGYGSLYLHDSAKACRIFEKLFATPAAPEAYYRYFELCSSDPNLLNNPAALRSACRNAVQLKHRVAIYTCGGHKDSSINSLKDYTAAVERVVGLKPWYQGTRVQASYMPLFFSDRDDFLAYTALTLEHNSAYWKFDMRKYLAEKGFKLENW